MIAQIIPNLRLPVGSTYFDYLVPTQIESKIKSGCLVTISFRNKKISGLVFNLKNKSNFSSLKSITSLDSDPIIKQTYFDLMHWFCQYYHVSWSTFLHTFLPHPLKKKTNFKKYEPAEPLFLVKHNKIPVQKPVLKKLTSLYLFNTWQSEKNFIQNLLKQKQPVCVFFSTIFSLTSFYHSLPAQIKNKVLVISGELNRSQYWNAWNNLLNKKISIVLSTRIGVFFPFLPNTTFVITNSENENYKQSDLNPRYSAIQVLSKIIELNSFKPALLTSFCPKLEHFTNTKIGRWHLDNQQQTLKQLTFIDLNSINYLESPLINDNLINKIRTGDKILLYLNRRGDFTIYHCRSCNYIFNCKSCGNSLKFYKTSKLLKCHYCDLETPSPSICPDCQGVDLQGFGSGIKNISRILKKQFTDHKILSLDSSVKINHIDLNSNKRFIILATEYISNKLRQAQFDFMVLLNADLDLYVNNFRAQEKLLQKYSNLIRICNTNTIIQTYNLDNQLWSYLRNDFEYFWKKEIRLRKKYNYPPFVKLVKLIYTSPDKTKVQQKTQQLYENLQKNKNITCFPPQRSNPFKQYRKYYMYVLVKYKNNIEKLLSNLEPDWIIDHDPEVI